METIRTFEERLSGLYHDTFATEAVLVVGIGIHMGSQLKSSLKLKTSRKSFIRLDEIHKHFRRKAENFWCDIFAREAVHAMGVGMHFYSISIEKECKFDIQKEDSECYSTAQFKLDTCM